LTTIIILILFQGCGYEKDEFNSFSLTTDTLIIRTEKHKDRGPFVSSHVAIQFETMPEESKKDFILPDDIFELKSVHLPTDYKNDDPDHIDIISGIQESVEVFIVDENNNNNFQDDSIRHIPELKWHSSEGLIKCKYLISNGEEIVEDSTWIQLRLDKNVLRFGRKEHLAGKFSIENENYTVRIIDLFTFDFTYSPSTWISLQSENNTIKDTLLERDILSVGEYLKLGQHYFRFEEITNNGEFITLIKEKDFQSRIGNQVGMIAPEFDCISVSGDTISSSSLNDKVMIIANSCGCGGDIESTEAYFNILKSYGNKIYALRLDSKIDKSLEGFHIDMDHEFNKDLYQKYRNEYCSRTCYVIGRNNRIIDRFPIQDWDRYLPKLLDSLLSPS
jgi:hypothetical protein